MTEPFQVEVAETKDEVAESTQLPSIEKQPPPRLIPETKVEVALVLTARGPPGLEVPIPTLPNPSMMKAVVVAFAVVEATAKRGAFMFTVVEAPCMDSLAQGVVEPMPTFPDVARKIDEVPTTLWFAAL